MGPHSWTGKWCLIPRVRGSGAITTFAMTFITTIITSCSQACRGHQQQQHGLTVFAVS